MSGSAVIENRTEELIETATNEVVLILGDESVVTDELLATLDTIGNGVDLLIGAATEPLQHRIQDDVPAATAFISGLDWLQAEDAHADDTAIGRLLLVASSALLVSSIERETNEEQAIFGEGVTNGLVVIARRLMAHGLPERQEPRT